MKLVLEKVNYNYDDLKPAMSRETLEYHRDNLANSYVKRFNNGEGDSDFNEAGAFLHNIFFPQFSAPKKANKPFGISKEIIDEKFESFDKFKEEFSKKAMSIQGSGWLYMDTSGEIKTIVNHQIKQKIALLVDWWEHAWALDYQSDKKRYLENIWKIIDWSVINDRLNLSAKNARKSSLLKLLKKAEEEGLPEKFPKEFRRWLRESCYSRKIDSRMNMRSRCRLSNYFFNQEPYSEKIRLYNSWKDTKVRELNAERFDTPKEREPSIPSRLPHQHQLSLFD